LHHLLHLVEGLLREREGALLRRRGGGRDVEGYSGGGVVHCTYLYNAKLRPPSTARTCPVTYLGPVSSSTTASATSCAEPNRCWGILCLSASRVSAGVPSGGSTTPGATAFTRICGASFTANARVACAAAAFDIV